MSVLDRELVKLNLDCKTKEEVINTLGSLMEERGYVKDTYVQAVLKREENYPTGLPSHGIAVAIPHTDSSHVIKPAISIATLKDTVKFSMMGGIGCDLEVGIVMLLAIKNPDTQVQLLKDLMNLFQDEKLLIKIKEAKKEEDVLKLLNFL